MAGNGPSYKPSRAEINDRIEAMQWMEEMGWPGWIIDAVMVDDNPEIPTVRRIVYQHGPVRALKILKSFLE